MSQTTNLVDGASTTDRLASMGHETIDDMTPRGNRAEDEIRAAATRVADSAKLLRDHAVAAAEGNLRTVRSYAESNTLAIAGLAFAAGVFLTAWLRR